MLNKLAKKKTKKNQQFALNLTFDMKNESSVAGRHCQRCSLLKTLLVIKLLLFSLLYQQGQSLRCKT